MHLVTAALEDLNGTAGSLDLLCSKRMTADGVKEHATMVNEAIREAKAELFKALTALTSMDSKAPIEIATLLKDAD